MEYISTKEASEKWGISTIRITVLANEGRIPGARRLGKSWLIPASATKPEARKANHSGSVKDEVASFSFPLYHFRPDYSSIKVEELSDQHKYIYLAENAVLECRFEEAFNLIEEILNSPDDIVTEIGALGIAGICCLGLNKPERFSKIFLRLKLLLSDDFPHKEEMILVLDILKTYIDTINIASKNASYHADINEQCLPLSCLLNSYTLLTKEAMKPGTVDIIPLELNLHLLKNTSALVVIEIMHCHLMGIYYLRNDMAAACNHAKQAIEIAFENCYYFPLATYYSYLSSVFSPIIAQYPEEFQKHCNELMHEYNKNCNAFFAASDKYHVISNLTDVDYPYIYAVFIDLTNNDIAERLGISSRTVKRKLEMICKKLGVSNKRELKDFLHNFM